MFCFYLFSVNSWDLVECGVPGGTWIFRNFCNSFSLFCKWSFIHQSLHLSCNHSTVFLAFPAFLEKIEEWCTFKSCIKERFWLLKKVTNIIKKLKRIRYVSSGSVLPLLHTICCYFSRRPVFVSSLVSRNLCMVSTGKHNFENKKQSF